ncbi:eukaryotic translation initiation factor 4E-binding protein 1-like [Planoprotostelium fungivorum]|uniref:Eukaryotic translation initiation factor 4E-binding protein 1-like n=1 Tax=Planoprotostelium fungivorum TaxID=1890364 RepID=A0A2P6NVI7_9EUKA|nr:eukaryotic translation initiation factor 4E-binding protein 1-like [Planoprotostelium fungivorum]
MSGAIPISARDKADGWFPNPRDLSTTPGGTIYATTPGGSRIVYDREALLKYRESPLAKTPTKVLPVIPGVTAPDDHEFLKPQQSPKILNPNAAPFEYKKTTSKKPEPEPEVSDEPEMFDMDK